MAFELGKVGREIRAQQYAAMTPAERSEIMRKMAKARYAKASQSKRTTRVKSEEIGGAHVAPQST